MQVGSTSISFRTFFFVYKTEVFIFFVIDEVFVLYIISIVDFVHQPVL